jgi:hypothetical protein
LAIVYEAPPPHRPVTRARSTVLVASRAAIAAAGYGARYESALDRSASHALDEAVAGTWLPVEVAEAHYRACDSLGLGANAVATLGKATSDRIQGTLYGTFIRVFQEAGGSPWNVFPQWQRFWDRGYDGGALRITKLGPKDARVDVIGCSLCASPYFRHALRGLSAGFVEVFSRRAYAQEVAFARDGVSYRYQWA